MENKYYNSQVFGFTNASKVLELTDEGEGKLREEEGEVRKKYQLLQLNAERAAEKSEEKEQQLLARRKESFRYRSKISKLGLVELHARSEDSRHSSDELKPTDHSKKRPAPAAARSAKEKKNKTGFLPSELAAATDDDERAELERLGTKGIVKQLGGKYKVIIRHRGVIPTEDDEESDEEIAATASSSNKRRTSPIRKSYPAPPRKTLATKAPRPSPESETDSEEENEEEEEEEEVVSAVPRVVKYQGTKLTPNELKDADYFLASALILINNERAKWASPIKLVTEAEALRLVNYCKKKALVKSRRIDGELILAGTFSDTPWALCQDYRIPRLNAIVHCNSTATSPVAKSILMQ